MPSRSSRRSHRNPGKLLSHREAACHGVLDAIEHQGDEDAAWMPEEASFFLAQFDEDPFVIDALRQGVSSFSVGYWLATAAIETRDQGGRPMVPLVVKSLEGGRRVYIVDPQTAAIEDPDDEDPELLILENYDIGSEAFVPKRAVGLTIWRPIRLLSQLFDHEHLFDYEDIDAISRRTKRNPSSKEEKKEYIEVFVDGLLFGEYGIEDFNDFLVDVAGDDVDDEEMAALVKEMDKRGLAERSDDLAVLIELFRLYTADGAHWSDHNRASGIIERIAEVSGGIEKLKASVDWELDRPFSDYDQGYGDDERGSYTVQYNVTLSVGDSKIASWKRSAVRRINDGFGLSSSVDDMGEYESEWGAPSWVGDVLSVLGLEDLEWADPNDPDDEGVEIPMPYVPDQDQDGTIGVWVRMDYDPPYDQMVVPYRTEREAKDGLEFAKSFDEDGRYDVKEWGYARRATAEEEEEWRAEKAFQDRQVGMPFFSPPDPPWDYDDGEGGHWFLVDASELGAWD